MLGHQSDMATQVTQRIVFNIQVIEQNLALLMVIETRNQARQRRLAATRTPDQRHHLPGFGNKGNIIEHGLFTGRILEAEIADLQTTRYSLTLLSTLVNLRRLI